MRDQAHLLENARQHITALLDRLPGTMTFHNTQHTCEVYDAVKQLCSIEPLNLEECFTVQMAAIFHDCGYLYAYSGHEESSMAIARAYLIQEKWSDKMIEETMACIAATKMPQQPNNLMQQIICDADMYHFTRKDYRDYADRLKREWEFHLNKKFDKAVWDNLNLTIMQAHRYFTTYAQRVWQPLKQKNIDQLQNAISSHYP